MTTAAKRSIKVPPVMYRQGTSELKEDGSIRLSISSDKPYLRYDWWNDEEYYEKLDHSQGGVDLERIRAGTALLFNHKRDVQLGTITEPELSNGKCFVAARVSEAEDVASHRTRIKEGILKDSSVGYELIDDGEEEGEIDGIPVFRFRWRPFEASLVTIPADISVGVGRERDLEKPTAEPREILIREKTLSSEKKDIDANRNPTQKRESAKIETRKNTMTPEEQAADEKARKQRELDEKRDAQERNEKIQDGIKAAREREKEIRDIAKRASVPEDKKGEFERALENAIEKSVTDEKAVPDFQTYVFKNFFGKAETLDTPASSGNGDLKPSNGKAALSLGTRFVESESFKRSVGKRGQGERVASVEVDFPILGIRGKVAMAQRAGFTSSDLAPVNIQIQTGVIGLGMQRLTIMDLIADGQTGAAAIVYPKENTFGTVDGTAVAAGAMPAAGMVGERGLKPNWDPDLTTDTANVKKVAITTKVPDEFLADFPTARSYIDNRLPFMVDTKTEQQILYGTASATTSRASSRTPASRPARSSPPTTAPSPTLSRRASPTSRSAPTSSPTLTLSIPTTGKRPAC
jgi:phage head maturation protease